VILLLLFAFTAGIVTIFSPCILPILPIVLTGAIGGPKRPWGIIAGFVISFTFFTLTLTTLVKSLGISADYLRLFSVFVIGIFGLSLLSASVQAKIEQLFSRLSGLAPKTQENGFFGGLLIGLSLGLIWTPCVGPILASVISLSLSGTVNTDSVLITLAYTLGTAIPMIVIQKTGRKLFEVFPTLIKNTPRIQRGFGALMILTAIAIATNFDRKFQSFILDVFPSYGTGLTSFESNINVQKALTDINPNKKPLREPGRPLNEVFLPDLGQAPELVAGGIWINSEPKTLADLKGKVVLVDFWTYSCINCIRTLPFMKMMDQKYRDSGLVIVGVHSPEFEFEKNADNVKKAVADFGIKYPVVQDNDFGTWRAYSNMYWPAKYLIDRDGHIRYTHFGEGEYDKTETNIQKLLEEKSDMVVDQKIEPPKYQIQTRTPETYLGLSRLEYFATDQRPILDESKLFKPKNPLPKNSFTLDGEASFTGEYLSPKKGTKLILDFESANVYLVANSNKSVRAKVTYDGEIKFPGIDVKNGLWEINGDRLYHLVNSGELKRAKMTIEFLDDGAKLFAFTFG
jgi:cytochrome c biogenesis protein CcdA/thiol-disulfide isomerase/thioredoxin